MNLFRRQRRRFAGVRIRHSDRPEKAMLTVSEAKEIIASKIVPLGTEKVPLADSVGRILFEDIVADLDLPPFDRSQMDGYAVQSGDTGAPPATLSVVGESAAGNGWDGELLSGQSVRIMTGARVPRGADAVQQVELTETEGLSVRILEPVRAGKNIVRLGAEVRAGDHVLSPGVRIEKTMIATLASFGYAEVKVARRPRLCVLSTGSEIVDIKDTPGKDQIRNSNSAMLAAFADGLADVRVLPIATDDPDALERSITDALGKCECLVISGGVSVGDYDFTKPVLKRIGAEMYFERLALKPGKPTVFGKFGDKYIFGLPGNPVSIAVTFLMFVRSALLLMQGASEFELPSGRAVLSHDVSGTKGRDGMLPVRTTISEDGRLTVESLRFSGSSNFITFARANALVFVPADTGLKAGDIADVYFF